MKVFSEKILSLILSFVLIFSCFGIMSSSISIDEDAFLTDMKISEKVDFNIVPGVSESYITTQSSDGSKQVRSYVLEIDMNNPNIGIITSYKNYMNGLSDAEWGMQAVRDQAVAAEDYYKNTLGQEDFEVVAGVNGDFFNMGNGAPTGTLVMNSKVYNVNEGWPYFAILKDGTPVIREGGSDVSDVAQSVGGPAIILRKGVVDASSGYGFDPHPRTAVGIKADGSVVFLVSDGRMDPLSYGQDFNMLADEMIALGCVDAICLDGGGSSTFVSQREGEEHLSLRNCPSDGIERTVSTAVLIYSRTDSNLPNFANKWVDTDGKISYYDADGIALTGEQTIDGYTYNFDENGYLTSFAVVNTDGTLVKNQWSGKKYLGEDGLPVTGEVEINNVKFTFDSESYEFIKCELKNVWFECDDAVYYFNANGVAVTGQQKIGDYTYKFDETGKLADFAVVKADGTLLTNHWVGDQYYVGADGLAVKGVQTIDGYKQTFDSKTGKFIKGELRKEGNYTYYYIAGQKQRNWHNIDGYWYYFDRMTGFGMATADNCDKVSIDFDRKDGMYTISTTDARLLFTFDKQGRLTKGSWLDTDSGKVFYGGNNERYVGWHVIDNSLYYFNSDTYAVTDEQIIDGIAYTFDNEGRLQLKNTDITVDGKNYYFDANGKVKHIYSLVVTQPTCTEKGYTTYICECGDRYIADYVDATGHNYKSVVTAPTCTEKGFTTYICDCGDSYIDNYVEIKHDYDKVVTEPTISSQGYTTYTCKLCGYSYVADYVGALGHDYDKVVTAPTCTEKGYTTYICDCGDSYISDYVDALGHDYVSVVTAPTCTQNGYTTYTCFCGDSFIDDYVNATHVEGEWETVVPVQADKDGLEQLTCKICGEVIETRVISATEKPSDGYDHFMLGDVNNDGVISAMDARLALRISAKIDVANELQRMVADYNGDKTITAMDARLILRKSAKLD